MLSGCSFKWPWAKPGLTAVLYLMDAPVGTVRSTHTAEGVTVGTDNIDVFAKSGGKVISVNVSSGDLVSKDTVLATVSSSDSSREISAIDTAMAETEGKISAAEAALAAAKAQAARPGAPAADTLAAAERAANEAEEAFKAAIEAHAETVKKHEAGAISDAELAASEVRGAKAAQALSEANRALSDARAAKPSADNSAIESATAALNKAKSERDVLIKARAKAATQSANAYVLSPVSGFVSNVYARGGDIAGAAPLFTLSTINPITVSVRSPNYLQDKLNVGDAAFVTFSEIKERLDAKIISIEKPGENEPYFEVRLSLDNEAMLLRPGMAAGVELITGEKSGCVWLPADAVLNDGEGSYVYVPKKNSVTKLPVLTGIAGGGRVEILSGLDAGGAVVVRGQNLLGGKAKPKFAGKLTPDEIEGERTLSVFTPATPGPEPTPEPTATPLAASPSASPSASASAPPVKTAPPATTAPPPATPSVVLPPAKDFDTNPVLKTPEV